MAEVFFDSDIFTNGKIKLSTVPNATGTVMTYNATTKELSTRTNAQIISDLGLDGGLTSYVKKAGDTMSGALTMNNGVNTVINKDLSTITSGSGFARDLFRLTGTNGIVDAMGWQGTVDSTGNITAFGYGYLGGAAYNVKNAFRWNANQQVRIGSTGVPGGSYALEVDGNTLTRGGYDSQNGYFNTVSGELLVQRFGVNRIRTNTASLILSGDTSNGIVYVRPQGDAVETSEVQFRSNLSAVFPSTYNLYFGNQASEGGSIFHTNKANTTFGYGMWMNYNLQYDGTNFIQPRGSGVTSFAFTANQHKGFSFNVAPPNGTNGGIVSLTEVVRFGSSGTITTLNDGNSAQWNAAYTNGFTYKSLITAGTDLNTVTTSGWYVQALNANALTSLNYPVANVAGQLRVYGGNAVHMVQEYTTYSTNNDVYRRYYFNGTWTNWAKDWDSNDFTQVNINSWNNIALNGATQQWVDQFYVNKSTQNVVKSTDWFITDDASAGMEGKFKFQNGYPVIQWSDNKALFGNEGYIDLFNYGIRQNDNAPNQFRGYTQFFGKVEFGIAQGTSPFDVISNTLVTNLNADYLDGFHASSFAQATQLSNYVPIGRTITIDGVTQDLSANRSWTSNNTVTRLRGGGSFVSGDITISAGANVTVSQTGQNITIAASDTNTTYSAGSGLTLTGTTFSLPVTITGSGNGVASVTQGTNGVAVTKADFATASQLTNFVTVTGQPQVINSAKSFNTNVTVTGSTTLNGAVDINGGWILNNNQNGGEYGMYPQDNQNDLIAGIENGYYVFGSEYGAYNGITMNRSTRNVSIGGTSYTNKLNVNGSIQANGLVGNSNQSSDNVWTTDGGYKPITDLGKRTIQFNLQIDGLQHLIKIEPIHSLAVVPVWGNGIINTMLILPREARVGQEIEMINHSDVVVLVASQSNTSSPTNLNPGDSMRATFEIDANVGAVNDDTFGGGRWYNTKVFKYNEL